MASTLSRALRPRLGCSPARAERCCAWIAAGTELRHHRRPESAVALDSSEGNLGSTRVPNHSVKRRLVLDSTLSVRADFLEQLENNLAESL
jgi:hypothetical protein